MSEPSIEKSAGGSPVQILESFATPHLVSTAGLQDADRWCITGSMALSRIGRLWEQGLETLLKPHGLIPAEMRVLSTLISRSGETLTMGEIKQSVAVTAGGVTKAVSRLEILGLVTRAPSSKDGRVINVTATDKGRSLARSALNDMVSYFDKKFGALGAAQRDAMSLSLGILATQLAPDT